MSLFMRMAPSDSLYLLSPMSEGSSSSSMSFGLSKANAPHSNGKSARSKKSLVLMQEFSVSVLSTRV